MDNTVKKITLFAPAKINLCLGVRSRRDDGYHNIESIMQTVDLCDRVSVTSRVSEDAKIEIICKKMPELPAEKNIAFRAAREFFSHVGIEKYDISVDIEKNIPSEAGLGGGSSDAAATIRALNMLFNTSLSEKELVKIGARVGADVPFLIHRGTAVVTGIGEELLDCTPTPTAAVLIAFPKKEKISTKEAYSKIDKIGVFSEDDAFENMKSAMRSCDIKKISAASYNVFEKVIDENSSVFDIKKTMLENGADMSLMSGSGSAVFGIFDSAANAKKTRDILSYFCETFISGMFSENSSYIES